jgi:hypothetical protein
MEILAQETKTVGTLTQRIYQTHPFWRNVTPEPRRMPNFHEPSTLKPQSWVTFPAEVTNFSDLQSFQTEPDPGKFSILRVQWVVSTRAKVANGVELSSPPAFFADVKYIPPTDMPSSRDA